MELVIEIDVEMLADWETNERIRAKPGEVYLVRKHQFVKTTKTPINNERYKALLFILKEDMLREYALEKHLETTVSYQGSPNILLPENPYLRSFFDSLVPHTQDPKNLQHPLSILKVKEAIELLLLVKPDLKKFLFDFSEPHKIDLEKFMFSNYKFNVPIENFAKLTGRSLSGFNVIFKKNWYTAPTMVGGQTTYRSPLSNRKKQ